MHRACVLLHRRSIQSVSAALPVQAQLVRHLSSVAAKGKAAAGRNRRAKGANAAGFAAEDLTSSGDRAAAACKGVGAATNKVASNPVQLSALMLAIKRIEQTHGKGSLMRFGDRGAELPKVDVIPTGSMTLDDALGVGGLPRGRVVEIYGPESSGKTTVALHVIAQAQRQGGTCVFIDAEHALDPAYAKRIGVNVNDLYISQPDNGEQALDIADTLIKSGTVDCVVVDSVAALVPKAELEGDMGDHHIALQARHMSQALRKLTATLSRTNCLLIFINQIRQKVGVIFGSNEVTTGGTALRFYSSVRLEIRKGQQIRTEGETLGTRMKVKVVKNKLAPPFGQAEFDMLFGTGIDTRGEVLDLALDLGLAVKSGSWFSLADLREQYRHLSDSWPILMGQGRDKAKVYLEQHPQVFEALADAVKEELKKAEIDRWSSSDTTDEAGEEESNEALEVSEDLDDAQKPDMASMESPIAAAADGSQVAEGREDVSATSTLAASSGETESSAELPSEPVAPRRRSRKTAGGKGQSKGPVASAAGVSSSVDAPAGATPLEFVAGTGPVEEPLLGGGVDLGIDYVTGEATNLDAYVAKKEQASA